MAATGGLVLRKTVLLTLFVLFAASHMPGPLERCLGRREDRRLKQELRGGGDGNRLLTLNVENPIPTLIDRVSLSSSGAKSGRTLNS